MNATDIFVMGSLLFLAAALPYAFLKARSRITSAPMSDFAKAAWLAFVVLLPVIALPLCFMKFKGANSAAELGEGGT